MVQQPRLVDRIRRFVQSYCWSAVESEGHVGFVRFFSSYLPLLFVLYGNRVESYAVVGHISDQRIEWILRSLLARLDYFSDISWRELLFQFLALMVTWQRFSRTSVPVPIGEWGPWNMFLTDMSLACWQAKEFSTVVVMVFVILVKWFRNSRSFTRSNRLG